MPLVVECLCNHCSQPIQFRPAEAGSTVECPHCHMETTLFVPPKAPRPPEPPARPAPEPSLTKCSDCQTAISRRAVVCPACGAIPSLFRVGWYTFVVMGVISIIGVVFWLAFLFVAKFFVAL